jgi:hypothetical protein
MVRIRDTLHLGELLVSKALVEDFSAKDNVVSVDGPLKIDFDQSGNALPVF